MGSVRLGVIALCGLMSGCSLFGYYRHERAVRAPPEEAANIQFPLSFEEGVLLEGPVRSAVDVAMNDFLPPGAKVKLSDGDERLGRCLSSRGTYDAVVVKDEAGVYFVSIFPVWSRCEGGESLLDFGAIYAIDDQGRIMGVR